MADPLDDNLSRFAESIAGLSGPDGGLNRLRDLLSQFTAGLGRGGFPTLTPVATPAGGGPSPLPVPTASPLAGGSPVATVLQPLNVQMAELVGVTKAILVAVLGAAGGTGGGGPRGPAEPPDKAGPGAFARLQQALQGVQQAAALTAIGFTALQRTLGEIGSQVVSYVQAFSPGAVVLFERAVLDLRGSLGEVLLPVMKNFQAVVRGVGDVVASLSPAGRAAIAGVAAGTVALVAMTAAAVAFSAVVNSALGGIPAVLGLVAGSLTAVLGGAAFALKGTAEVQSLVDRVAGPATAALNAFGEALVALAPIIEVVAVELLTALAETMQVWANGLKGLAPVLAQLAPYVAQFVRALVTMTVPLVGLIRLAQELGLIDPDSTYRPGASQDKGVRQTSFGSVEEYLKKAYVGSYNGSGPTMPTVESNVSTIAKDIGLILGHVKTLAGAGAAASTAASAALPVAAAAVPGAALGLTLTQQMLDLMRTR